MRDVQPQLREERSRACETGMAVRFVAAPSLPEPPPATGAPARVVDEHVNPAEALERPGNGGLRRRRVGDVERRGEQALVRSELRGERARVARGRDDRVPALERELGEVAPEAP